MKTLTYQFLTPYALRIFGYSLGLTSNALRIVVYPLRLTPNALRF
jgi:hypothetical protein